MGISHVGDTGKPLYHKNESYLSSRSPYTRRNDRKSTTLVEEEYTMGQYKNTRKETYSASVRQKSPLGKRGKGLQSEGGVNI